MKLSFFKIKTSTLILFLFIFVVLCLTISLLFITAGQEQIVFLAKSFAAGRLDIALPLPNDVLDFAYYQGRLYWVSAPLAALPIVPLTIIFGVSYQILPYTQSILLVIVLLLTYRLARIFKYSWPDSLWQAAAFCFASIFLGVAAVGWSFFMVQMLATIFLLLTLLEFYQKRRPVLLGLLVALAMMTRYTLLVAAIFYPLYLLLNKKSVYSWKDISKKIIYYSWPILLAGAILLYYNYLRFGSILETGYSYINVGESPVFWPEHGLFNWQYIPVNIYYYFLRLPELAYLATGQPRIIFDQVGLSFFLVSPIFLFIFRKNKLAAVEDKQNKIALLVTGLGQLFLVLTYFSPGAAQFLGPRYMIDALPWFFALLLYASQGQTLSRFYKGLIILSASSNFIFLIAAFIVQQAQRS